MHSSRPTGEANLQSFTVSAGLRAGLFGYLVEQSLPTAIAFEVASMDITTQGDVSLHAIGMLDRLATALDRAASYDSLLADRAQLLLSIVVATLVKHAASPAIAQRSLAIAWRSMLRVSTRTTDPALVEVCRTYVATYSPIPHGLSPAAVRLTAVAILCDSLWRLSQTVLTEWADVRNVATSLTPTELAHNLFTLEYSIDSRDEHVAALTKVLDEDGPVVRLIAAVAGGRGTTPPS